MAPVSLSSSSSLQADGELQIDWPGSVQVGVPFEVLTRWKAAGEVRLEGVPDAALPADLWAPFEFRALGEALVDGTAVERSYELLLLDPPMEGAQLAGSIEVPGPEVWLRPVGGGSVEALQGSPVELPLITQVEDAQLARFERIPWSFAAPAPSLWPLAWVGLVLLAGALKFVPPWFASRRRARERQVPVRAIEAWLTGDTTLNGAALHEVSDHLRILARNASNGECAGRTVEEARAAGMPEVWTADQREVLWSWWSADQLWNYGGQLPDAAEAKALTDNLARILGELGAHAGVSR